MVYGVCETCAHTQDLEHIIDKHSRRWYAPCHHCGGWRWFRVVRQIEQADGSVIEVRA